MKMMMPEEFVGRCVDAALRTQNNFDNRVVGTTLEKIMSFDLKFGAPIDFHYMDNDFHVELTYREEMVFIVAEMVTHQGQYRGAVVLSKINGCGLAHWVFHETNGSFTLMSDDLTLLSLATDDTLDIGTLICR